MSSSGCGERRCRIISGFFQNEGLSRGFLHPAREYEPFSQFLQNWYRFQESIHLATPLRDISPSNVIVGRGGRFIVIDAVWNGDFDVDRARRSLEQREREGHWKPVELPEKLFLELMSSKF